MDGYRTLKAGQAVRFDVHQGPKGNHASVIVPVEAETAA
jgi:CspA family cold shock protein